jgi:hypothetical protein
MVPDEVLKGASKKAKTWSLAKFKKELTKDEAFVLQQMNAWEGAIRYTNFVDDFGMYVYDMRGTMQRLESLGLVKKWWHTPGKRRIMMYEFTEAVDRKLIKQIDPEALVDI